MSNYGRKTRQALKDNKLAPKKRFGQNFLVNKSTAEAIVRAGKVTNNDIVIEVGVGLGALTNPLAAQAKHVFGFEIDSGIVRYHQQEQDLPENVTLIHKDILQTDFKDICAKCGDRLKILANLPYSISNPFIFTLIDNWRLIKNGTVMVQKEVADRLCSRPRSKDYGIPTVLLGSCATVRQVLTLKPAEFHPRPKVDSVVIYIEFFAEDEVNSPVVKEDFELFKRVVKTTFNHRRKTIHNTLSGAGFFANTPGIDKVKNKELTLQAIQGCDLDPKVRPEELPVATFLELTSSIRRTLTEI